MSSQPQMSGSSGSLGHPLQVRHQNYIQQDRERKDLKVKALTAERVAEAEKLATGALPENGSEKFRQLSECKTNVAYPPTAHATSEVEECASRLYADSLATPPSRLSEMSEEDSLEVAGKHIRVYELQKALRDEKKRRKALETQVIEKSAQIKELRRHLQQAENNEVEAESDEAAARFERKWKRLRDIFDRTRNEKAQLEDQLAEASIRETTLRRELSIAELEIENNTEKVKLLQERLESTQRDVTNPKSQTLGQRNAKGKRISEGISVFPNKEKPGNDVGLSENRRDGCSRILYVETVADTGHANKTYRMVSRRAPTAIEKLVSGKPRRR